MGAGKRGNSSRYGNSGGSPGADAARNVGIVLGLGGLSFFLGFFVLSRMVPDRNAEGGSPAAIPASAQSVAPASRPAQSAAAVTSASPETAPVTRSAPSPRQSASADVTIEPADETPSQKPASLDKTADSAGDKNADSAADKMDKSDKMDSANAAPDATLDTPRNGGEEAGTGAKRGSSLTSKTPVRGIDDGDTPSTIPPTRKTRRVRSHNADSDPAVVATPDSASGGISESDQKPSRIDRDESDAQPRAEKRATRRSVKADTGDSADETTSTPAPAHVVKRSRYRVAAGSYAQRESAERAAHRVTDLGLDAAVVPVTKDDGTTVYRVQQGVYRSRANAEAARQKLSDAGLDAEVIKTGN